MKQSPEVAPLQDLIGQPVADELTGRVGVLMAVIAVDELACTLGLEQLGRPAWVAFLRPRGGGREWITAPGAVSVRPA